MIKTRFAPSPTGLMHLGNARSALFNALLARHHAGIFLLRIEDTDLMRSKHEYDGAIQEDLRWLEYRWQEGPGIGGDEYTYYQSQRREIYDDYYRRLEKAGYVYHCFCSENELKQARQAQRLSGKPPRYSGICRGLSEEEVHRRHEQGLASILRFRLPEQESIIFMDLVRGEQTFCLSDFGDFVIRRADGSASFLFCNAIDDALMEVTHVLRGEDHLANTPRQILLLRSLGLSIPTYAHISLIVGPDQVPLSKRHGSRSIRECRELGYLPLALNNYLARLGHDYGHHECLSLDVLAHQFNPARLSKSAAQFDQQQLDYWQKCAVSRLNAETFWLWAGIALQNRVPSEQRMLFVDIMKPNVLLPKDVERWLDICFADIPPFTVKQRHKLKMARGRYFDLAISVLKGVTQLTPDVVASMIMTLKQQLGLTGKLLHQPLRLAITAQTDGPPLAPLLGLMSIETILKRLSLARDIADENI